MKRSPLALLCLTVLACPIVEPACTKAQTTSVISSAMPAIQCVQSQIASGETDPKQLMAKCGVLLGQDLIAIVEDLLSIGMPDAGVNGMLSELYLVNLDVAIKRAREFVR